MIVRIRDNETGAVMHGTTMMKPLEFSEAFARGYDTTRFSYRIVNVCLGTRGKHKTFRRYTGFDPAEIEAHIRARAA